MEVITGLIVIVIVIWLWGWVLIDNQRQTKLDNLVVEVFDANEEKIRETQQYFITLIEILYKKNEKELEVELSNKGFNQLEYIFNDIREQDIRNSKNKINDDKSRLEVELRIKHESNEYNKTVSGMKEQFDNRQELTRTCKSYLNNHQDIKEQLDEQTDLLLNGDLSPYYEKLKIQFNCTHKSFD
jgi:hypothetical protein